MQKKFLSLVMLLSLASVPMQAMQGRNPEESCGAKIRRMVYLGLGMALLGKLMVPPSFEYALLSHKCLPEDELGGRCSTQYMVVVDRIGNVVTGNNILPAVAPFGVENQPAHHYPNDEDGSF